MANGEWKVADGLGVRRMTYGVVGWILWNFVVAGSCIYMVVLGFK